MEQEFEEDEIIDWTKEANGVIQDIIRHVQVAQISHRWKPTDSEAYMNFTTLEGKQVCVKLNAEGLQIVGDQHDRIDQESPDNMKYETPYSLLSSISPAYTDSFGSCLAAELSKHLQDRLIGNGDQDDNENLSGAD
ncbi:GSK3-beta interaction protein [Toxorhynchites rutilus septentrionalis]|uniref:GSK3-beta interaction protein n=1 Tax=Toxorhynchites rutilus septentrionalis TaxID=329112 RepID=UPI00247A93D3|nr:GSK3-beta interaction protein [Toxorhynchites rutilus septentrionalis]